MIEYEESSPLIEGEKKSKSGGGTSGTAKEYPNTLRAKSTARVVDLIGEGPIVGLVNTTKGVFFDGTPLVDTANNVNYKGVVIHERLGYPDQDHVPGFTSVENETDVSSEVKYGIPVTRSISGSDLNAVRVKVTVPGLTKTDTTTGDVKGTAVQFTITITSVSGGQTQSIQDTIDGKTVTLYSRTYRCDLPGTSPWNVTVTRNTIDAPDSSINDKTYFGSYTTIIDGKFRYPDSALIGLEVDAELFGGEVPTRGYLVDGLIIQVPANYNAVAKTYATSGVGTSGGIWNGTFTDAHSDNPVWCLLDILTNTRYGLGIAMSKIDLSAFYTAAQYCDQRIPDGFGGTEPRFTFNYVMSTREDAYRVLQSVASSFRGMCFWASGTVSVVADMPMDPVKLVTPANVIDGMFTYNGSSLKARHSIVKLTWNDPDDEYKPAVEVVEDTASLISGIGVNELDVTLIGCTRRSQARRHGLWILDTEKTGTETVTYVAALDHADVVPGDIVEIADPDFSGVRYGGRVFARTSNTVTLDDVPDLGVASFTLDVTLADGSIVTKTVASTAVVSGKMVVTISGTFSTLPPVGAVWVLTGDVFPRQFRIISNVEKEDGTFEIGGLLHDPNKYDRVELGLKIGPDPYTRVDKTDTITPPANFVVTKTIYTVNNQTRTRLVLSWPPLNDILVRGYEIRFQAPSELFTNPAEVSGVTFEVADATMGTYVFDVRSVAIDGRVSAWARTSYANLGNNDPPGTPTGLAASAYIQGVKLSWTLPADTDLAHTEVWRGTTNNRALLSSPVAKVSASTWNDLALVVGTTYYYWVRCVDTSGNIGAFNAGTTSGVSATPTSAVVIDTTPPGNPTNLAGTAAFESVFLTWDSPSDSDVNRIEVWENTVNTQPNPSTQTSMRIATAATAPSQKGFFARTGLSPGVTRYYWIRAMDASGNVSGFNATSGVSVTTASLLFGDFADGVKPIGRGAALPTASSYAGDMFFLTTDAKLYRKNTAGTAWQVAVPTSDLAGQITTTQISDNAITTAKILAGQVDTLQLAANAVTADKILAGEIRSTHIATDTIYGHQIKGNTITATNIFGRTITADKIGTNEIDAAVIKLNGVELQNMATGAVSRVTTNTSLISSDCASEVTLTTLPFVSDGGKLLISMRVEFTNTLSTNQVIRVRCYMNSTLQFDAGLVCFPNASDVRVFSQVVTLIGAGLSHTSSLTLTHGSGASGITSISGQLIITELKKAQ